MAAACWKMSDPSTLKASSADLLAVVVELACAMKKLMMLLMKLMLLFGLLAITVVMANNHIRCRGITGIRIERRNWVEMDAL